MRYKKSSFKFEGPGQLRGLSQLTPTFEAQTPSCCLRYTCLLVLLPGAEGIPNMEVRRQGTDRGDTAQEQGRDPHGSDGFIKQRGAGEARAPRPPGDSAFGGVCTGPCGRPGDVHVSAGF